MLSRDIPKWGDNFVSKVFAHSLRDFVTSSSFHGDSIQNCFITTRSSSPSDKLKALKRKKW